MTPKQFFSGEQQLERYEYAKDLALTLIHLQKDGMLLCDGDGNLLDGTIVIRDDFFEDSWGIVSISYNDTFSVVMVSVERDDMGYPYIPTKAEIKKALDGFSYINPSDIKKIEF